MKNAITTILLASFSMATVAAETENQTETTTDTESVERIVVTADFRESDLSETAGSISVYSAQRAEERGAQHLQDILSAIPNVNFASGASRSRFLQVRGIGDLEQYAEPKYYPSVGIMLDDIELGDAANAGMLFDTQQVEVLRGPQGTRFGSSAFAGMVKVKSNPASEEFEGKVSTGFGNYGSYNGGLVLSSGLTESLRARVAVQSNQSDGFYENKHLDKDDTANIDETTARLKLEWDASENLQIDFNLLSFVAENGIDYWSLDNDRNTYSDNPGMDDQDTIAISVKADWQINDENQLIAIVNSVNSDLDYSYDADWISAEYCTELYVCDGPWSGTEAFLREREKSSIDLRLVNSKATFGKGDGQFVFGIYASAQEEDLNYQYDFGYIGESLSTYETDRVAIYGEYEYGFTDKLSASVGVRLEKFEDDFEDSYGFTTDHSDDLVNGEIAMEYKQSDDTLLYGVIAFAEKPSGVNVSAIAQVAMVAPEFQELMSGRLTFDVESLTSTELGIKGDYFDNRLSTNFALFHSTRENAQLENWMYDPSTYIWIGYLDSSSDVTSYGAELDLTFSATEDFILTASLGLLETEVESIETFDQDLYQIIVKTDREQAKSPNYQYSIGALWYIADSLNASVSVDGKGDSYFGYYHDGKLDSTLSVNASVEWSTDNLSIRLWGRNLTDEDNQVHGLYSASDPRVDYAYWSNQTYVQLGEPRTYGINASYAF
ncbi:TonB-dependent receptor [Thalassotalea crassostreae]|uniref:TonB-dependent receptor n=1 Tax=Thalassotalea crassostreae TaxID=1763536 RepID=UPI000837F6AF|nr:TonB-dependent receptor [Thalassotalea crassostreae]